MKPDYKISTQIRNEKIEIPVFSYNTVVVGTGAAGYACVLSLLRLGQKNIAVVTEGIKMGTSRNTGSDKQTYYKMSTNLNTPDSAYEMAKDLMAGGAMHGDIALTEAALSLRGFYNLVSLGVPFPHDRFGEYTGYRTDHDEKRRATSCGPLTSKLMTEALENALPDDIPIYDGYRVIQIITRNIDFDKSDVKEEKQTKRTKKAVGITALSANTGYNKFGLVVFSAQNVVYAVGGASAIYSSTVYPESQTCGIGTAFLAGAEGINLTESQYGIASTEFRWNLSGSYQQVLPRYISRNPDGSDEREFLRDYFDDDKTLTACIFKKGYQWPFDPRKINENGIKGSSCIDLAVFAEESKGREVFLDFRRNPSCCLNASGKFDINLIDGEAHEYLIKSESIDDTPIKRLRKMNEKAYNLYLSHGINLEKSPLKISVCAQHCNGGLAGDIFYESVNVSNLFPIGEVNGVFGVYRPGGSALNSTQVSAIRVAEKIAAIYLDEKNIEKLSAGDISNTVKNIASLLGGNSTRENIIKRRYEYGKIMSGCGTFLRNINKIESAISKIENEINKFFSEKENMVSDISSLTEAAINYDVLISQLMYLNAIREYIKHGGKSRGSYLITDKSPLCIIKENKSIEIDNAHKNLVCRTSLLKNNKIHFEWESVRPIPDIDNWFEKIYNLSKDELYSNI